MNVLLLVLILIIPLSAQATPFDYSNNSYYCNCFSGIDFTASDSIALLITHDWGQAPMPASNPKNKTPCITTVEEFSSTYIKIIISHSCIYGMDVDRLPALLQPEQVCAPAWWVRWASTNFQR